MISIHELEALRQDGTGAESASVLVPSGAEAGNADIEASDALARGGAVGLVLVGVGLVLLPWVVQLARRIYPGRNVEFARWGFSHVVVALFGFMGGGLLTQFAVAPWLVADGEEPGVLARLLSSMFVFLIPIAYILRTAIVRSPNGLHSLGLRVQGSIRAMLCGAASYLALLPALFGLMIASAWMWRAIGVEAAPQEHFEHFSAAAGGNLGLALVLAILVLPLFEEIVFRSFLQPLLVQNFGDRGGVAMTSFWFAFMHGNLQAFVPIFALSLVLGGVMLRTQRLAGPFFVHALHNGSVLALFLVVPGGEQLVQTP